MNQKYKLVLTNCNNYLSRGYTHLGFEVFQRVNGLGLVQLRFHITLGYAVTQYLLFFLMYSVSMEITLGQFWSGESG